MKLLAIIIVAVLASFALPARALCTSCTCTVSAPALTFGQYSPSQSLPTDNTGQVQVSCSGTAGVFVGYTVALSSGQGSFAQRELKSGSKSLTYNLYADALRTQTWGDGTGGSTTVGGAVTLVLVGSISSQHLMHGRIPARQNVGSGTYSDAINVTISY